MVKRLNKEFLHSILYMKEGSLFWKRRDISTFQDSRTGNTWNTRFADKKAGTVVKEYKVEYVVISIAGKRYYEHRLLWEMFIGPAPDIIDHIDGNGLNNSLDNLRDGRVSNMKNIRKPSTNKSGIIGVHWCNTRNKWVAQGQAPGRRLPLGRYDSLFDAACARKSWEIREGYDVRTDRK